MHVRHSEAGVVGSSAIVGGNPPHVVGHALADEMLGQRNMSVTFFGDGVAQNGASYEAMNIAVAQSVPVILFIENYLCGVLTHLGELTCETRLEAAARQMIEAVPDTNSTRIRRDLRPEPVGRDDGIVGELAHMTGLLMLDHADLASLQMKKAKFIVAASEALAVAMGRDPGVIVTGEDSHKLRGGVSGSTKGALER